MQQLQGSQRGRNDPDSNELHPLFNPRRDDWDEHFRWDGAFLLGTTAIGRTTINILRINLPDRVAHRQLLIEAGEFPPRFKPS